MWTVLVVAALMVALGALAWWSSGRSRRRPIDPAKDLRRSDAYTQSMQNQTRFDPGGPG